MGDAVVHSLRTGAVKGLGADGAGCNAWLQLGMIENPLVDPGFWSIVQTIRCARDCGDAAQVASALSALTSSSAGIPDNCISVTLLSRLQTLGWHIDEGGRIHDVFGRFSLFECMHGGSGISCSVGMATCGL